MGKGPGEWLLFYAAFTISKSPCLPSSFRKSNSSVLLPSSSSHFNLFCISFPLHGGLVQPLTFVMAKCLVTPLLCIVLALLPEKPLQGSFVRYETSCSPKQLTSSGLLRLSASSVSSFALLEEGYFSQFLEAVHPTCAVVWQSHFELHVQHGCSTSLL